MRRTDHPEPERAGQLAGVRAVVLTVAMVAVVLAAGTWRVLALWLRRQRCPAGRG